VYFTAAGLSAGESTGSVSIPVNLSFTSVRPVTVNYTVTGGNATAGVDYTGGQGILSFSPGVSAASISIGVINNEVIDGNRSLTLTLINPRNATLGMASTTITIVDDDALSAFDVSLVSGWNLISLPMTPENRNISALLPASVTGGLVNVWGWNESEQNWMFYSPDPGAFFYNYYPALTQLEPGKAYWFEMNRSAAFTVRGTVPACAPRSPTALVSGWSLVGATGLSSSAPAVLYPDVINVWGWDAAAQNWVFYSPDPNNRFKPYYTAIETIQPGQGYWVEMA
jgi:hypothetical protein